MIALNDKLSFFLPCANGKGVLLLHGLTGIPAEMKFVARRLNLAGYAVYAPLLAGHGNDRKALEQTTWQDWLQGVIGAAEKLRHEFDEVYTAGICVGGKLGMMAAHFAPELIKATAVYSPCFRYDGWNVPWYYRLAPLCLPLMVKFPWLRDFTYPETASLGIKDARMRRFMQGAEAQGVMEEFPVTSLLEMVRLGNAMKKQLPSMRTPALILHADEDDLSHPRNAQMIANSIGAPHRIGWIQDSYHMIHMDAQHRRVAALTADFFKDPTGNIEAQYA